MSTGWCYENKQRGSTLYFALSEDTLSVDIVTSEIIFYKIGESAGIHRPYSGNNNSSTLASSTLVKNERKYFRYNVARHWLGVRISLPLPPANYKKEGKYRREGYCTLSSMSYDISTQKISKVHRYFYLESCALVVSCHRIFGLITANVQLLLERFFKSKTVTKSAKI